jgi:serine/threonine-protein kinase HipA
MDVWMEGRETPVGVLSRAADKSLSFLYADNVGPEHRISMSLPISANAYGDAACRGYFENLLFEGPQLAKTLKDLGRDQDDVGALLWHLGADCAGAISVTPEGAGPGKMPGRFPQDYEMIAQDRLAQIVLSLHQHRIMPEAERDPSLLAGVQGKLACAMFEGTLWLPKAGSRAPTTHILKVSPEFDPDITLHETALLRIAAEIGIEATRTEDLVFEVEGLRINALLSTRFDRDIKIADGTVTVYRRHAEDFCHALGLAPSLKYERSSINPHHRFSASAVAVGAKQTTAPALLIKTFLAQTLFNLLVGNTDNHGKNASLLYRGQTAQLAPLYDVVPVVMDSRVTHAFAFRLGHADFAEDFDLAALRGLLCDLGYGKPAVAQIHRMAKQIAYLSAQFARKDLAASLHAKARVLEAALGADFGLAAHGG